MEVVLTVKSGPFVHALKVIPGFQSGPGDSVDAD